MEPTSFALGPRRPRRPLLQHLVRRTPARRFVETTVSSVHASLPGIRAAANFVVLLSPGRRDFAPEKVLGLDGFVSDFL